MLPANAMNSIIDADAKALEVFLTYCKVNTIPSKRLIIRPGDPADRLYYIVAGSATISMTDEEGNDIILDYLNAGDFIGETGLFVSQSTRHVTVRSRVECDIAEISYTKLEHISANDFLPYYPDFLHALATHISKRLHQATRKVGHLAFMDAAGRIASALLDLCKQPDALTHPEGMQIKISRTELGRIVGCSREMVGRVMKNMELQGLITAKGKTIVVFGTR